MPSPRAAGGVAAWHGKVIYAGGLEPDGAVARVDAYDPQTDEWTRLADMPRPREHFHVAVVGDELYAIGGRETFESDGNIELDEIAEVDVLDLPADDADLPAAAWRSSVTSLPIPRGGLAVAAVGECIYAIGGERAPGGIEDVTGVTESYDPVTGNWRELSSLWTPRHGIQAATIGETIYIAAGGTKAFDYSPTAEHEALDVSDVEPCLSTEGEGEPSEGTPNGGGPSGSLERTSPLRITRLAVRPQQVRLNGRPPAGSEDRALPLACRQGPPAPAATIQLRQAPGRRAQRAASADPLRWPPADARSLPVARRTAPWRGWPAGRSDHVPGRRLNVRRAT